MVGSAMLGALPAAAAPTDVVLSELMYHPSDDVAVEFLELHNVGTTPVDVSGWCLATGIDLCFANGTVIAADGFLVVTDDLLAYPVAYPDSPAAVAQYTGSLSNGGETIDLVDAANATIDTVSYDDAPPWPSSPDGDGPSLEVIDPTADNSTATNWTASVDPSGHTAGLPNSQTGVVNPTINSVTADPSRPNAQQPVVVSATISEANSATLTYRIGFEADITIPMDDGPGSVGGAGDGVWSTSIPGQATGSLIRYRIEAVNNGGALSSPSADDTINYHGVTVAHNTSSNLLIIEWFMEDAVYDNLLENHRFDDVEGEAVIAIDGVVFDNAAMHIRGNSSRNNVKVSWKVDLPKGHLLDLPGLVRYPVDEFNLQGDRFPVAQLGWQTAIAAGALHADYFKVRSHRNGEFWAIGSFSTNYDGVWRDFHDVSDWAIYKANANRGRTRATAALLEASGDWDKKERDDEDFSDIWELTQVLDAPPGAAQQAWMWENLNIPRMVNYAAVVGLLRHSDSSWSNYYVARDTDDTGRWEMWLWDIDQIFVRDAEDNDGDFLTPAANEQRFMVALMAYPEFRQMYMRRLRTLSDEHLFGSQFEQLYDSIAAPYLAEAELDRSIWGGYTIAQKRARVVTGLEDRRSIFAANMGADGSGLIPPTATGTTPIQINEINYNPINGGDFEFIELVNTSSTESIDLSGWTVSDGVDMTLPAGTIILPNTQALLVASDSDFRSSYGPTHYVIGEYDGGLNNSGETITLRSANGTVVDSLTWSDLAPWPTGPAGLGPSLSRLDAGAATNDATNWAASEATGGTPGSANDGVTPPPPPGGPSCSIARDGTNITVTYTDLDWNTFIVRRVVNGAGPYWRGRVDGQQTGTFIDTDRPGTTITYDLAPRGDQVGGPLPCQ